MTIFDFAENIPAYPVSDPEGDTIPWRDDAWPTDERDALEPETIYAVVQFIADTTAQAYAPGAASDRTVIAYRLFQRPKEDGTHPAKGRLYEVFNLAKNAPYYVDDAPFGLTFEDLRLDSLRIPPMRDPNTPGGLMALVQFVQVTERAA